MSPEKILSFLESRFRSWLLGRHPYNTVFSFNWVNVRPMVRTLRELAPLFRGRVADLGAGSSPYHDLLGGAASQYVALDYPASLTRPDDRAMMRVGADVQAIPLVSGCVDAVLCSQVLSQVERPDVALVEMARILKSGGHAVVSAPHISALHSEPHDLYRFTPDGLRRLLACANLRVLSVHAQGGLFASFALCLAMNLILSPPVEGQPMNVSKRRQLMFAPIIALVNAMAAVLDRVLAFGRTPVNLIMVARKP
jgi:SAM-dependent methyltransferase